MSARHADTICGCVCMAGTARQLLLACVQPPRAVHAVMAAEAVAPGSTRATEALQILNGMFPNGRPRSPNCDMRRLRANMFDIGYALRNTPYTMEKDWAALGLPKHLAEQLLHGL